MPRIRTVKPEIRRSLTVCSWPYPVRWTFVGLPGYMDDEGRAIDDVRLVKAELYPLDDDMTARKIDHHLNIIATDGPLCRYVVAGQRYMHITSWSEHQRVNRPSPSRIPPCPTHEESVTTPARLSEDSVSPHGTFTEPSLPRARAEQGREQGTGNRDDATPLGTRILTAFTADRAMPRDIKRRLGEEIDKLVNDGLPTDRIWRALVEWGTKPDSRPGLLPYLVSTQADEPPPDDVEEWRLG